MAGLQRGYRSAALILLNLVVVFVVVNAGLYVVFRLKDARTERNFAKLHESESLAVVYPGMDARDIHQLVRETWSRPYVYEALTQFKERPFRGRFVNVSESGFRLSKDQGPWPPDPRRYNILLFGGSTAFGYGVPDDQTIASHLQEHLSARLSRDVRVYNFGRSSYVSSQERVLFQELLVAGIVPDLALFVDGLNEFAFPDGPVETPRLKAVFEGRQSTIDRWRLLHDLPVSRLARHLHRTVVGAITKRPQVDARNVETEVALDDPAYDRPDVIARVIERYLENMRLIDASAHVHGIQAVFVWQPIPLYKYDLAHHLFAAGDFGTNEFARHGYRYMERRVRESAPGASFLWCADMQDTLAAPLYVDKVHYTAHMSRLFASIIADRLIERELLDGSEADSVAHGAPGR